MHRQITNNHSIIRIQNAEDVDLSTAPPKQCQLTRVRLATDRYRLGSIESDIETGFVFHVISDWTSFFHGRKPGVEISVALSLDRKSHV